MMIISALRQSLSFSFLGAISKAYVWQVTFSVSVIDKGIGASQDGK